MFLQRRPVLGSFFLMGWVLAGCSGQQTDHSSKRHKNYQYSDLRINLSENASMTCFDAGGILVLAIQLNGNQTPVCQLANGRRCDERALLDGGCTSI
ncbi:DUF333 domain-containing protein [Xenorhabdus bovienii]|uniref:Lipoprotein n=1 Tax=Xenorhabdus bovienii TaxID=40576 RepID=A0A0B6X7S3_XENBV|nr:DUF333 domain-containing protein [Xenorhabdus bovienii]CDM89610.1 conserved exported protein of unknown function [Xenorhabdus bovienii]